MPKFIRITRSSHDSELWRGEEGASSSFGGHFEGACYHEMRFFFLDVNCQFKMFFEDSGMAGQREAMGRGPRP